MLAFSGLAGAQCIGTSNFQTCNDLATGNSYTIQRYGNMTNMQGHNSSTGSNWNQTTQSIGNMTIHNGTAADGNTWSGTTQRFGNTVIQSGRDSRGNSFNRTCINGTCY